MTRSRRSTLLVGRLLLWALCFGTLAPAISQWLALRQQHISFEICAPRGDTHQSVAAAPSDVPSQQSHHGDVYCGYCTLAHHLPFLPSSPPQAVLPRVAHAATSAPRRPSAYGSHAPHYANAPRAPPVLA
ncbi:DUF2946 domain-containing protein [Chitinasiproducens palmae]|uniref:DUF2946 domain-containing protein n=1 Tax=Chitinasiproducens palmae TaxID=1770053 RepID=UPI000B850425